MNRGETKIWALGSIKTQRVSDSRWFHFKLPSYFNAIYGLLNQKDSKLVSLEWFNLFATFSISTHNNFTIQQMKVNYFLRRSEMT